MAPKQPRRLFFDRVFAARFKDHGELSGMSIPERRAVTKRLADRGHSRSVIAELLECVCG
jgi:hypothetical protein